MVKFVIALALTFCLVSSAKSSKPDDFNLNAFAKKLSQKTWHHEYLGPAEYLKYTYTFGNSRDSGQLVIMVADEPLVYDFADYRVFAVKNYDELDVDVKFDKKLIKGMIVIRERLKHRKGTQLLTRLLIISENCIIDPQFISKDLGGCLR